MKRVALVGDVWPGGSADVLPNASVLVSDGRIGAVRADGDVPEGFEVVGGPGCWVGPGIVDAHVHLAFGTPAAELAGGLVAVRDLGAPADTARAWRTPDEPRPGSPHVAVVGPLLTGPGGYPSRSWGRDGFALFVADAGAARAAVGSLVADGVDAVKLALEPAGGPVPDLETARAVTGAAHDAGLAVTAHALTAAMVVRALDAGVDELAHTPTELLPQDVIDRIAGADVHVVSTLTTLQHGPGGKAALENARALVAHGVRLVYGTDLGNAGTRPGVDPRELRHLAESGLGILGALRSATEWAAETVGRAPGSLTDGHPAYAVVLASDPLTDVGAWKQVVAVVTPAGLSRVADWPPRAR